MMSLIQQSWESGVLADGWLANLKRRVSAFIMVLMKLDLQKVILSSLRLQEFCQLTKSIFLFNNSANLADMVKHLMQIQITWT